MPRLILNPAALVVKPTPSKMVLLPTPGNPPVVKTLLAARLTSILAVLAILLIFLNNFLAAVLAANRTAAVACKPIKSTSVF